MKKNKMIWGVAILISFMVFAVGCQKKQEADTEKINVRLNEVVHSIFYAPQYVALENGFFEEEGLAIDLSVGQGANYSMTALISDSADIALLGIEAGLYVVNEGAEDYPISFAQLTQRAGNYVVAREPIEDFTWDDVRGKTIIGGRAGGMPQMILEYILRENGIQPGEDVEILTNLEFTSTAGAFTGGIGDFTVEFDPTATVLEQEEVGYVVAFLGTDDCIVPYTVYMVRDGFLKENPEAVQKFTNAIYKGQIWVQEHTGEEIAQLIQGHFPESDAETLAMMVERYKAMDVWQTNPSFSAEGFELIQDIMEQGGELSERVPFDAMITNEFALEAIQSVQQ